MEPAAANGANALANLTPAELAQQARQRDGARQMQRPAEVVTARDDAARPGPARAVRMDTAEVPPVRAADLTQRAQFDLTAAQAGDRGNAPQPADTRSQPEGQIQREAPLARSIHYSTFHIEKFDKFSEFSKIYG